MPEHAIIGLAINGLRQHLKPFVLGKSPKTFEELREAVNLASSVAECSIPGPTSENTLSEICASLMTSTKSAIKEEVHALGQFQQNRQGDNEGQRQWSNDRNRRQWNNAPQPWTNNKQRQGQQQNVPEQTKCRGCGKFCRDRRKCPAFNVKCDNCGIWRHFASVCEQPNRQQFTSGR
ncbi:unnamed protein product [Mytilus coruscus]|uniref:CCHC-type domain-containing protein n=1 Tax=Mytilus coruscus TaxID=42192 RepID=A0A6J8AJF6_MYTCO|nr:unnamed protein product [Mytilus coruscus]